MARGTIKAMAGLGMTALLLAGCSPDGDNGDGNGNGPEGGDPVATEMRSWEPCEVLDNLQPFIDFMGITEFSTSPGEYIPDSAGYGEASLDPDAIICGANIVLPDVTEGTSGRGVLTVKIVPLDNEEQAIESYNGRAPNAVGPVENIRSEIGDPWDEGVLLSTVEESGATEYVDVVARDGQWVFQVELQFTGDFYAQDGGEPAYPFTNDELYSWLVDTYLPAVNQTVNDRAAGGE
ncbi:hypothetical protein [Glycomyces sp. YM15]|uniref:hypothetical protein n=1 Tax=Glycomyces sp. YM15 TaxID=2800446 RepID=UPI001965E9CA|nr:hypothetical protein [Glycomyces sp. YM15]